MPDLEDRRNDDEIRPTEDFAVLNPPRSVPRQGADRKFPRLDDTGEILMSPNPPS